MKKRKFNVTKFMVYFMAFIMVSSVFGVIFYGYNQQDVSLKYNGISFTREDTGWSANLNNQKMYFDYHPGDVESINISEDIVALLKNHYEIDATSDVNDTFKDTIALVEYSMANFLDYTGIYLRTGFTTDNEFDLPVIKCSDSTKFVPVIYFKESDIISISLENNCIIAEARNDIDFIRIKDRILYSVLGIIE